MNEKSKNLGLIAAIIITLSVLLKVYHLPGAGIGMVLSLGILFPIYCGLNIKNFIKNLNYSYSIIYIGISFLILTYGLLFIIMHWPGGGILFRSGFALSIITLFVVYFIEKKENLKTKKFPRLLLILIIVIVSMIYIVSFRGISRNIVDGFLETNQSSTITKDAISQINEQIVLKNDSSSTEVKAIHKEANDLINQIEWIKQRIAQKANDNEETTDYNQIRFKENFDVTNQVMILENNGLKLKERLKNFEAILFKQKLNEKSKIAISKLLNTETPPVIEGNIITWESSKFENFPAIAAISILSSIENNIIIAEYITVQNMEK